MEEELAKQRKYYDSGITHSVQWRIEQLKLLKTALGKYEAAFLLALEKDLGKCNFEGYATEIGMVYGEINDCLKHIGSWSKVTKVRMPLAQFPSRGWIQQEPLGLVLIIAPWNYPVQLTLSPLVAAIAAGNCVALKPSEFAPKTAEVLQKMMGEYFNSQFIGVYQGGIETSQRLLAQPFDHIFYTGSGTVGKSVMQAAAEHLTPVTLELGGKSPCLVERSADLTLAARRIVWGKCLNSGQTCVAPDYLLVQTDVKEKLMEEIKKAVAIFYPGSMLESPEYSRIVNSRHFDRLQDLMKMGKVVQGGESNRGTLKMAFTMLDQVHLDSALMRDEIFGPLLPVINFENLDDAVALIKRRPKPLALYLFTKDKRVERKVLQGVSFGGGCVNDTIVHLTSPKLPFGGIGGSGMGAYHGKKGFDTFSHQKSILKKSNLLDLPVRYPPYGDKLGMLRKILR